MTEAPSNLEILKGLNFVKVLNQDPYLKLAFILVDKVDPTDNVLKSGVVTLEKLHFAEDELKDINLESGRLVDTLDSGNNDIYHWYKSTLNNSYLPNKEQQNKIYDVKIQLIFPATQNHIDKYSYQKRFMIKETIDTYKKLVNPYIDGLSRKQISWVDNILDGLKEQDRIVHSDPDPQTGYVLAPDSKWDRVTMDSLYLLVLVQPKTIRSIRDLNASHLPLLKNILSTVPQKVASFYNNKVGIDQLRLYFHYHPTYYHLHVHVTHVQNMNAPGMYVGQAHLLSTVIENIERFGGDYYQRVTLDYSLGENHPVYKLLKNQ